MWRPNAKMNFWDELPSDLQNQVLQARAAATIQKNWRRHPAVRSTCLAKGIMGGEYGIEIISPWTSIVSRFDDTLPSPAAPVSIFSLVIRKIPSLFTMNYRHINLFRSQSQTPSLSPSQH